MSALRTFAMLGGAASTLACGTGQDAGFGMTGAEDSGAQPPVDATEAAADTAPFGTSSPAGPLFAVDSSLVLGDGAAGAKCSPGTYAGQFNCNVTALLNLIQIPWNGDLSLTFVPQTMSAGEFKTLSIAPGAHISGTDQYGGTFSADLSGTLDCLTRKLSGTLDNGTYVLMQGLTNVNAMFTGGLAGDYVATATPPAFANGTMGPLESPQFGGDAGLVGSCTWTATLQ